MTFNYRLGILGFLYTESADIEGNYALFDIFAALLWIKTHIKNFHGDPDNISIMGYGEGAALTQLFLQSKLFQNNNLMTIRHLLLFAGNSDPYSMRSHLTRTDLNAKVIAKYNLTTTVRSLQNLSLVELLQLQQEPSVTDSLRPRLTHQLFGSSSGGKLRGMDVWWGLLDSNVGHRFNRERYLMTQQMTARLWSHLVRRFVRIQLACDRPALLTRFIEQLYQNWTLQSQPDSADFSGYAKSDDRIHSFNSLLNDALFVSPVIKLMQKLASSPSHSNNNLFLHLYSVPSLSFVAARPFPAGSGYLDDLFLLLGAPLARSQPPPSPFHKQPPSGPGLATANLSLLLMDHLIRFVKTG